MSTPTRVSRTSDGSGRSAVIATPHLSVVVASDGEVSQLENCLRSLEEQCERTRAELIVARSGDADGIEELQRNFPQMRFLGVPGPVSDAALRSAGMRESTGDVVVFVADDCAPRARWLEEVSVGVDNLPDRPTDSVHRAGS